ncbi:MAG: CDGSH iron-sulfur domain-containing protein [Magnetovibrio sp.]|nr:CDGSH iron-sulfur domain-containing protein [Magnetovibrio sp.]
MSDDLNQSEPNCAQKGPYEEEVIEGRPYFWCTCGHSQTQPFCNGTHRATSFLPMVYNAEKTGTVYFCGCKKTKTPPFCDGTHNSL